MSAVGPSLSSQLRALTEGPEEISLGLLVDRVGEKGFGLLLLILSLPSALPVPAPGYSIPFGIALAALGLQLLRGRTMPWFPEKMRATKFPRGFMNKALEGGAWMFARAESLVRPRLRWITSRMGRVGIGLVVLIMAGLMMIPIPGTNTFPAMVIFILGVALVEEDGLFGLVALAVGVGAVLLYAAIIAALILYGPEGLVAAKDWIEGLFAR